MTAQNETPAIDPGNVEGVEAPANGSVVDTGNGGVVIEQGPEWLVELAFAPPAWLSWGVNIALVVLIAGVAWGCYRVDVDEELLEEWGEIVLIVGSIGGVTHAVSVSAALPYLADVVVGTAAGFCVAQAVLLGARAVGDGDDPVVAAGNNH